MILDASTVSLAACCPHLSPYRAPADSLKSQFEELLLSGALDRLWLVSVTICGISTYK
jgi:hypothetical protein